MFTPHESGDGSFDSGTTCPTPGFVLMPSLVAKLVVGLGSRMSLFSRVALGFLVVATLTGSARAQTLPSPDQARRLLETRPDLVAELRKEIASSGLTPD